MKISYNWLKDYINFSVKPQELAEDLTMAGLEVKGIEDKGGDYIFEAEITSNRPDWLCLYGVAREIGALYGLKPKPLKSDFNPCAKLPKPSIKIEDKKGCLRYVGIVIDGVEVGASPEELTQKLESSGIRPVNNVVDITNFCLMESGQPLHAFDYDKLEGGVIIVRRAKKGEEITTIDGVRCKLDENILVIADANKPVAIAGIMGGKDTEVNFSTKRILLESAYFDPILIRQGARKLGISTESSYRFERNVDIGATLSVAERTSSLICDLAKAKAVSKPTDIGTKNPKDVKIALRISRVNSILGTNIPASKCASILKGLGLGVKPKGEGVLSVSVPSFRRDAKEEIDLIEEISRIYGYAKIPETLTDIQIWGKGAQKARNYILERSIRDTLTAEGLNEIITYALRSKEPYVNEALSLSDDKILNMQNPLSSESATLRPALICGILDVVAHNLNRKISDVRIFELGKSYLLADDATPCERDILALAICGMRRKDWQKKEIVDIFDLKGIIEALFERLGISGCEFEVKRVPLLSPSVSAAIKIDGKEVGFLGAADKRFLDRYDIKSQVFLGEIDLEPLYSRAQFHRDFSELPRYPSAMRDISLIVADNVSNKDIVDLIRQTCGELAVSVTPFDLYRGEQIPKDAKSILYSVEYRASDRTLTDEEVNALDNKVREALAARLGAKLR